MLPAEARLPDLLTWVEQRQYFVVHAARQTGKTTAMRAFAERLRALGYAAVWATLEECQGFTDVADAEPLWLAALDGACAVLPPDLRPPPRSTVGNREVGSRLRQWLTDWCAAVDAPVVLLLDEADVVSGPALVNLLRQLRAGFTERSTRRFPDSIALIGMRDLRDYLTRAKDGVSVQAGSPFNIKSASLTLRNFTLAEIAALYQQHTDATGQVFSSAAVERAEFWTSGQPFLVNALARDVVTHLASHGEPITSEHIDVAKRRLILDRVTHIDSLAERLKEDRVARIVAPILLGEPDFAVDLSSDDLAYCVDLGLLRLNPHVEAANPIYREVMVRLLSLSRQPTVPERDWLRDGKLDVAALVEGFLVWWRRHADALRDRDTTPYREAVPQIVFMAWVQKVVNGGGEVTREFALGRGRIDVVIRFAGETHAFELKRVTSHDGLDTVRAEGIAQAVRYLDRLGTSEAWVLFFDERPIGWEQKLWRDEVEVEGKRLHLRGG
jgi:hypothetical protein